MSNVEAVYPLSPLQEGMLFHSLYQPGSGSYVDQIACRLEDPAGLAPDLLVRAFERVVERHPALRTAFAWELRDRPRQVVLRRVNLACAREDWRGLPAAEREVRLRSLLAAERARGFDLARAPLLRLTLIQAGEEQHQLVLTYSHLLMDAWSLPLVFREVAAVYGALRRDAEPDLPPARPYSDFIAWLQRQDASGAAEFWRRRLRGLTAPTPLGGRAPQGPEEGPPGDLSERLPAAPAAALRAFASQHRLTLNSLVQGAWALLLARSSSERDVLFGITVAGRPAALPDVESIVGLFINTLPLRVQVPVDDDLVAWLQRLQAEQVEIRQHEHSALPDVQGWSEIPRGIPLFDSILVFENYPLDRALDGGGEGLGLRDSRYETRTNYALTLLVMPGPEPELRLLYDRHRFDAPAAARLLAHLRALLTAFAAPGRLRLSALPRLSGTERHQLLVEWNDTASPLRGELCLHAWLEERSAACGGAVAVECAGAALDPGELWRRAGLLATHLQSLGVGPESRVAVHAERSLEMVVAVLGVLKAGGAYVPLDPDYPRERLALVLEDSAPAVVLTQRRIAAGLPATAPPPLLLDGDEPWWDGEERAPLLTAEPGNLAYVLYTSGSTGRPKGVQISHCAAVNFLRSMAERPGLGPGDVLLAVTSLSFDIAGLEIFLPLAVGARLVVATREQAADGKLLAALLDECGATAMQATPATWRMLIDSGWRGRGGLAVLCGGEALPPDLARELCLRGGRVWNLYGPTETTIWSAVDAVAAGGDVTLGRPIANTGLHVLDDSLEPVPLDAAGELHIGGAGLSRGYLGRPDLTAERFVPSPFAPGERLYKTGDLVRRRADGRLEFAGRLDHQLKVRGFRIEPAEVEEALRGHPAVGEAVVVGREDASGSRALVAYVVANPGAAPEAGELRRHAQGKLPPHMVPSVFVLLDALPLTPNGKLDRQALPDPGAAGAATWRRAWASGSPVEQVLAGIWAEILPVPPASPEDDFFALGGHSLLATQLVSRLRQVLGVEVGLPELFAARTLAGLARRVAARGQGDGAQPEPPLRPVSRDRELPLSFAQQRLWVFHRLEEGDPVYNLPTATRLSGRLDPELLRRTLERLMARHEMLRTRFAEVDQRPVQVVEPPAIALLPLVDLSALPEPRRGDEARRVALAEIRLPFDLERGPLLRARLLCLQAEEHVALFTLHHIAGDGWSMGVLVREVMEIYRALAARREPALPPLPVQYADFAVWQRERLAGAVLETQLGYWLAQLAGVPLLLELPGDRPRPAVQSFQGATLPWRFPAGLRASVQGLERAEGVTLFMVLLAAFQVVVREATGRDEFVVGTDFANRNRVQTEALIGFFVNQLPVAARFGGVSTFRQHLRRVREATFGAHAHQDVPFDRLVEALKLGRSLAYSPLLQVKLNLHNFPRPDLDLPGLRVRPEEMDPGTSKMDLILDLVEQDGELLAACQYKSELFDATTIERLLRDFQVVVEGVAARPDAELSELALRLEGGIRARAAAGAVAGFPLSPQQEHLWRQVQRDGGAAYVSRCTVAIRGDLSLPRLGRALEKVTAAEEILRTTLQRLAGLGTPVQVIADEPAVDLAQGEGDREPFDLTRGPLLRAQLERRAPLDSRLHLAAPSILLDGASLVALVGKLARAYAGEEEGEPLQYAVITEWLNEMQTSEEARPAREAWLDPRLPAVPLAGLPFERPAGGAFRPERRELRLDAAVLAPAVPAEVSVEAWLLAAWQALLGRVCGRAEVAVGTRCDGRADEELSTALGLLERYLPVRAELAADDTLAAAAARAERALRRARGLQDSFRWSELERLDGRFVEQPYFPFAFELVAPPAAVQAGGVGFALQRWESCSDRFEVRLTCVPVGEELRLELGYDAEVLPEAYAGRLLEQLAALLADAALEPGRPLTALSLLGAAERRELVEEFNASAAPVPLGLGLHQLFEEQVRRTPRAAAIETGGQTLSFRELDERSNRLARRLRRLGVGADARVALLAERSSEMVIGLLGILKAGGAYVPVDPGYPAERVRFMLADSGAPLLVTCGALRPEGATVLRLDADWGEIATESAEPLGLAVAPEQTAYVIYTSGSTGRPKGVMVPHGAIVNQMSWLLATYPLAADDVVFQKTPFSFDASVWELWAPLLSGARLLLAEPGRQGDAGYLARTCRDRGVTVLQLVPSLLRVLLEEPAFGECSRLRRLFCGGEALGRELVEAAQAVLGAEVVNLYGPTEATVQVLSWMAERPLASRVVPLGRPVWNTASYVLDGAGHPCAVGIPGELFIGGAQLARGYLGRPELTAERFVPDPLGGGGSGARLYRTGDLARYLPAGSIEFLGRIDHQVKVRGVRIELGEIESALAAHPALRQAVAVVWEEGGSARLVAYLVGEPPLPGAAELRAWLGRSLPETLLPSLFVPLDELPRLPNGKVDRAALPVPEPAPAAGAAKAAPRTPTEELVAQVWGEVLGHEGIGAEDDFFALGGHSLLATQTTSRLAHLFRVELSLRTLFETPTVAGLAALVDARRRDERAVAAPPIVAVPRDGELPLSIAQETLWLVEQLDAETPAYNTHLALVFSGRLEAAALERALAEVVRRHEVLRTSFPAVTGRPYQSIRPELGLPLARLDLSALAPEPRRGEMLHLAGREARTPFDLAAGPLVRARLLHLGETEHVLLFTIHHIVSDGWSLGVLTREVGLLYQAFAAGRPSPLAELPIQYADFAAWQRRWLSGEVLERHLAYWICHLEGAPPVLALPTDRPRPAVRSYRGERQHFVLGPELSADLRRLGRSEGVTPFMLLLAALDALFHLYSGQEDIVIGSPIANRNRLETEGLVGFFVNTLALRARLSGAMRFRELLAQVRETVLEASAHQALPFEKLVEELRPERHPGRTPLYQTVFTMQNAPLPAVELPGLTLTALEIDNETAKFDLTVNVWETAHGFAGSIEHSTDLFEAATGRRMWRHLERLLEGVAIDPDVRIDALAIFSAEENTLFAKSVGIEELDSGFLL